MKNLPTNWGVLLIFATGIVAAGCGGGGQNQNSVQQPTITSTYPTGGATSVPINFANPGANVITANFSEAMQPASFTTQTFFADSNNGQLTGVVTYSNQMATLTLNNPLPPNSNVTVKISGFSADSGFAHPSLGLTYVWSFKTGS
jgi:hypothetical protein